MASPSWRAAGTKTDSGGSNVSSISVPPPVGHQAGDLFLLIATTFSTGGVLLNTTISGWTLIATSAAYAASSRYKDYLWYRVATSSSEPNVTVAAASSTLAIDGQVYAIQGVDGTTPVEAQSVWVNSAFSTTVTTPAVTTLTADALIIYVCTDIVAGNSWTTPPTGATEQIESALVIAKFILATEPKAVAGTEAADVYTRSVANGSGGQAITIAAKAAAGSSAFLPQITVVL